MESYYVLNQRIPRFYILDYGPELTKIQVALGKCFAVWLKDVLISNVARRKYCSACFELGRELQKIKMPLENLTPDKLEPWLNQFRLLTSPDFAEFLVFARSQVPDMKWMSVAE